MAANNKIVPVVLVGLAALCTLIAMFTSWWTAKTEFGGSSNSESAGPFNTNDGMIGDGASATTGLTTLLALLLLGAATALMVMGLVGAKTNPQLAQITPWAALAGGVLLLLGLVLAIFMYPSEANDGPGEDIGFWDSQDVGTAKTSTGAGFGWYLGAVGAILGIVGGVKTMMGATARTGIPTT